jgi:anti-sigma factor RsiW
MDRDRRKAYEAWLQDNPETLRRVRSYQMQIGDMFRAFGSLKDWK